MKQKTITTDKATLLLVELPEGITEVTNTGKRLAIPDRKGGHHFFKGNWQILGRLPDITEEQASQLFGRNIIFKLYQYDIDTFPYMFTTGLEAFNGLLEANGIMFENPLGKIHPHHPNYTGIAESIDGYLDRSDEWKEAQQKVWDRNRTYIFKQLK